MSSETQTSENAVLRVLVVDDDPVDRLYCMTCLKRSEDFSYEISEADSGASTMSVLADNEFDCMLLDQNLPDATGIELLDKIREQGTSANMAVIILTGQDTVEVAAQALRGGASDYVQKRSVSTEALDRAISNAAEKVQLEQAIFKEREVLAAANDELTSKHREIQNFYHQVSHELRTPITSLREFVSIVFDGLAEDHDEQQEYLGYAMESCDRLSSLVEDLIDATRAESGKLRLREGWSSVDGVFEQLGRLVGGLARDANVNVVYQPDEGIPEMWADPERILQVLTIFMTNAIKFTDEGGDITVKASKVEMDDGRPMMRLGVQDSGCGIAAEDQEAVFSRLFQVEKIENEASVGLGLGLSIAKEIVELHKGEIGVTSEEGVGSEFFAFIPVEEPQEVEASDEGNDDIADAA